MIPWIPILNRKIWINEIVWPRFPREKIKSPTPSRQCGAEGRRKRLHCLSLLSKYRKSLREKKNKNIKGNLEIQFFGFVSFFWQPLTTADCYLHTYHHLCFFTREDIPASLGTFAQAVRNKYLQGAGISSSWALNPDSNSCAPPSSLSKQSWNGEYLSTRHKVTLGVQDLKDLLCVWVGAG